MNVCIQRDVYVDMTYYTALVFPAHTRGHSVKVSIASLGRTTYIGVCAGGGRAGGKGREQRGTNAKKAALGCMVGDDYEGKHFAPTYTHTSSLCSGTGVVFASNGFGFSNAGDRSS